MQQHRQVLSLWEIAHRWNNLDPVTSQEANQVSVVDSLDFLFREIDEGKLTPITGLAGSAPLSLEATKQLAVDFLKSHRIEKSLLTGIGINRWNFGETCVNQGIKLPGFWFDADDEYEIATWGTKTTAAKLAEMLQPVTPERIAQAFGLPIPEPEGLPLHKLQRTHLDQIVCQRIAEKLWHDNPGASYADIHHHPDMTKYGNAGVYGLSTIKDWLRSVAPQDIKRGGRPKKAK